MHEYPRPKPGSQPLYKHDAYRSTIRRAPMQPHITIPHSLSELTCPLYGHNPIGETDNDLTRHGDGEAIGERIAKNGPLAVQAVKRSVQATEGLPEEEALKIEMEIGLPIFGTEDAKEGTDKKNETAH